MDNDDDDDDDNDNDNDNDDGDDDNGIPDICYSCYTGKIFGAKILHQKVRKLRKSDFATK